MPTNNDKTVSVSEAAAMLHVSEKTIRRRIKTGELTASKEPLDIGGVGWRVQIGTEMDIGVDIVPDIAMDTRRNRDGQSDGQNHAQDTSVPDKAMDATDNEVDTGVDRVDTRAGTPITPLSVDRRIADRDVEEIARQREEILFLRGLIEQHQRSEAELRASLREALRAMPKQLEVGTPTTANGAPETRRDTAPIVDPTNAPTKPMEAAQPERMLRPLWKVMLGIR